MKKKQLEELKAKGVDELMKLAHGMKRDIQSGAMDMKLGKIKNLNEVRTKKKERAKVLTILHAKMKGGNA
ncbi:MAG: hypothetical protein ACM3IJ_01320 [Candidatus Levyibacteriota bacterium]